MQTVNEGLNEEPEIDEHLLDHDNPIAWIERYFWIPETNAPIKLEPYQKAVIEEALRRDEHGDFIYSLILYSDIKKSAKSTIAAAVCLYLAWHHPWETVRVVANDLKQADSRTFFYIERAITGNEVLRSLCKTRRYHIDLPNHTTIDAIPVDPKGEAGGGDLVTCFTELWAFKNEAAKRLWSETTLSPLKFGRSIRWCESYAGFDGESPVLEQLYETGVENGEVVDVGIDGLELYVNQPARQLTLWNTQPRCPWQSIEYYSQESAALTPNEFQRMHRNQWVSSEDSFVPIEWWDACKGELPPIGEYTITAVGIDAGVSSDCFGIVAVSRHEDKLAVRYVRKWTPPRGGKLNFAGPEAEIRRMVSEGRVACFVYDPYQLHDMMTRLKNETDGYFKSFNQGEDRLLADKRLYDLIRDKRIIHSGEPDLREHLMNANAKTDNEKLRIIKRAEHLKIDLAVCLSMVAYTTLIKLV